MFSILYRYVFTGMMGPFAVNLVFFSLIFLTTKLLEITNLIVNYRIGFFNILMLFMYSMPAFLVFVIPMSVMMGVLLTFLRMSTDNEILALKSGGVSLYRMLPPVAAFSVIGAVLTAVMTFWGMPWGNSAFEDVVYRMSTANPNIALKERTFNDAFDDVLLYADTIDLKENTMQDIFIEDRRSAGQVGTIIADKGKLIGKPKDFVVAMRLYDGLINRVDIEKKTSSTTTFHTYDMAISLKNAAAASEKRKDKDEEEMRFSELRQFIAGAKEKNTDYYKALIEFHNKFSIPAACLVLGLLAVPLGVRAKARKKSYGLGLGLFFFLCYYALMSLGWVLGESGTYPPAIGIWVPNVVMGGVAVFMFVRSAAEKPLGFWKRG
ncbi:MAG: LPS export ABC transporter permease LptF [Desulfobacterales bacterium]